MRNIFISRYDCVRLHLNEPDHESQFCVDRQYISFLLIADNSTCRVEINGKLMKKSLGEVWNSVNDLCQKYTCEMGPNGEAIEKDFREYCLHACHNVR